nr:MAG TPA: hypothetical protein [Bacteriophage sp.]
MHIFQDSSRNIGRQSFITSDTYFAHTLKGYCIEPSPRFHCRKFK